MKFNLKEINSYIMITLGLVINTFSWVAFLIPAKMIGGGVAGIGTLIYYSYDIPVGYTVFALNLVLISIAIKILGKGFGAKTIYAIVLLGILFYTLQLFIKAPIIHDNFLSAVLGGGLAGIGVGLTFSYGGSTAGTDVIAMIINKYYNISPGRLISIMNIFIIASSYLVFHSLEKIVYSYVSIIVAGYAIDMILVGQSQSVQVFVLSDKYKEIADNLTKELHRGVTVISGMGWYKQEEKHVLMLLLRKKELKEIFKLIKRIDPKSFMSIGNVNGVYGKGFESIK